MFKHIDFTLELSDKPFANLRYRDRTTLIVAKNAEGGFYLGGSMHYPEGIVRLMGGGVEKGEAVVDAAIREVQEEMNVQVLSEELVELAVVHIKGTLKDELFKTDIYLYYLNSIKDDLLAGDDVEKIVTLSLKEFKSLIARMNALFEKDECSDSEECSTWGDYGKVYGFVHQVALDEISKRGL